MMSVDGLIAAFRAQGYEADRATATSVYLSLTLERPLLLEGEPGVGKTELAKALAKVLGRSLLRLQCYDGLEQRDALYEWNYAAQMLHLRAAGVHDASSTQGHDRNPAPTHALEQEVYQSKYLIRRPLLQALEASAPGAVLLIDEVDRFVGKETLSDVACGKLDGRNNRVVGDVYPVVELIALFESAQNCARRRLPMPCPAHLALLRVSSGRVPWWRSTPWWSIQRSSATRRVFCSSSARTSLSSCPCPMRC